MLVLYLVQSLLRNLVIGTGARRPLEGPVVAPIRAKGGDHLFHDVIVCRIPARNGRRFQKPVSTLGVYLLKEQFLTKQFLTERKTALKRS